jgi:hypothetical protein
MKVVRVKILGKVENMVCRILGVLSTVIKIGFDVHDERGKYIWRRKIDAHLMPEREGTSEYSIRYIEKA